MGYDGVNLAVEGIRGEGQLKKSIDTGAIPVTKDNLDAPTLKAILDPNCENKPPVTA